MWLDESVVDFQIVGNGVADNGTTNINVELSDTGIIADNLVYGAEHGVFVFDTGNVKIYNNRFSGNSRGSVFLSQDFRRESTAGNNHDPRQPIPDPTCPWLVRNIVVANNVFGWNGGRYGFQFYVLDKDTNIPASSMNIVVTGNLFHTRVGSTDTMVAWGGNDNHTLHRTRPRSSEAASGSTGTTRR